jgi:DNA primase
MTSDLDINDNVLAELRSAADIVEVIGDHTRLKKAGRSWKGLCPFHNERTPSFTVDRDKGLYHCFGCGAGGDVIHFVRQIDRLDFPEAVEALASRFGVSIPRRAARDGRIDRREKLLEAVAAAHRFYVGELERPGNPAAAYLESRGVSGDLVRRLGLGFAPAGWDSLARALSAAFPENVLLEAGLLQPGQEGKRAYDRFRERLLFVVRDDRGRPVGFGGRALASGAEPKYLNSPESPLFQKKRLLYGLSDARDAIRRRERVILVEGYFDHLAMAAAGLDETVASMGTALTPEQCEKLRRLVERVVVCYDGDPAGRAATRSALSLILAQGFQAAVVRLPDGEDPHDVLRREGPRSVSDRVEGAADYLAWLLDDLRPEDPALTSAEKTGRTEAVLDVVRAIPDPIRRYEECRRVSRRVAVPLEVLWQRIAPAAVRPAPPTPPAAGTTAAPGVLSSAEIPAAERWILQILLSASECKSLITEGLRDEYVTHPAVRRILETLRRTEEGLETIDFQRQIAHLTEEDRIFVSGIALEEHPAATPRGVESALKQLERRYLEREESEIQRAIEQADAGQRPDLRELILRKEEISRRKAKLGRARKWERKELGD